MSSTHIGRSVKVIEDPSRMEVYEPSRCRSFPVSIFYPTGSESCQDVTLLDLFDPARKEAIEAFSSVGITGETLNEFRICIKDHADPDLCHPLPVVVFSPGFGIDRDLYVELHTSVVKAGYVVVAVGVPYDSFFTVFPDGRVVLQAERFPTDEEQIQ